METNTKTSGVSVPVIGTVPVTYTDRGEGPPVLLLHGGGGPLTVNPFADRLAAERPVRVLVPVHPGFAGTPRPSGLTTNKGIASLYKELLADLDLSDVTVVGNSMGGWIASELALQSGARLSRLALVDAVGIRVDAHPIANFYSMTPRQVSEASYHDPERFGIDPSKLPADAQQAMAANRAALTLYAGADMFDSTLAARLAAVTTPTLVLWGDSDRIVTPDYGRAFANAIPGAKFELLKDTGHLPQIESPLQLIDAIFPTGA